jgi:hypothetical protein
MDDIPVMSRAACRNHAVRTLGYVNHTTWLTCGKGNQRGSTGNGGVAQGLGGGGTGRQRGCICSEAGNYGAGNAIVAYRLSGSASASYNLALGPSG